MNLDDLMARLECVRACGSNKWTARCPAHNDKNPSLSIAPGEKGILLRCWAGCTIDKIVDALGLSVPDLFFGHSRDLARQSPRTFQRADFAETASSLFRLHSDLFWIRGHSVLDAAKGLDTSEWTDEETHISMEAVAKANADIERANFLDELALSIRTKHLNRRRERNEKLCQSSRRIA